jgi:SpoIID/LytB domain protein
MRSWRGIALVLAVPSLLVGGSVPALGADRVQSFAVPASGRFALAGHGYGHGHGMSQYGAQSAALQGRSTASILSFYYPGTRLEQMSASIRVLLTGANGRNLVVLARGTLRVIDRGAHKTYTLPAIRGVRRWRIHVVNRREVVEYRTDRWRRFVLPGRRTSLVGDGEFRSSTGRLFLATSSGIHQYRGGLRAASPASGSNAWARNAVNVLSVDNYVKGVVPREMPTSWKPAAVRAQAIAARTYALFERAQARADGPSSYDICDTTACQVYGGVDAEDAAGNAAVTATADRYLAWRGVPAFTQFSASDGGWTAAGGHPYLPAKADPYDNWSGNPYHGWSVPVRAAVLQKRYPRIGTLRTIRITSRAGTGEWGGPVNQVRLIGSSGAVSVSGYDIRAAYGLRSTWFMPQNR